MPSSVPTELNSTSANALQILQSHLIDSNIPPDPDKAEMQKTWSKFKSQPNPPSTPESLQNHRLPWNRRMKIHVNSLHFHQLFEFLTIAGPLSSIGSRSTVDSSAIIVAHRVNDGRYFWNFTFIRLCRQVKHPVHGILAVVVIQRHQTYLS